MLNLNTIFCSNMIMQAKKPVRFFGTGKGEVKIAFNNEEKRTKANGDWTLEFSPVDYGGPYSAVISFDGEKTVLENIYFGDVYLLSGQSNMQLKLSMTNEPKEAYQGNENVRLFTVDRLEDEEYFHARDGWVELTKDSAEYFSSLGYYIGQNLATDQRKIGLIACYQGASNIQTWLPKEVAQREEFLADLPVSSRAVYPLWNDDGQLFEYQLKKILPYAIAGVVWYQGESNTDGEEGTLYFEMLRALVESWRESFMDNKLPFVVVQIADLNGKLEGWKRVQDAQLRAGKEIDGVDCVICRDICENDDIHPKSKRELGKRIADVLR
jgi:sialate O-acetylesterase